MGNVDLDDVPLRTVPNAFCNSVWFMLNFTIVPFLLYLEDKLFYQHFSFCCSDAYAGKIKYIVIIISFVQTR